MKTTLKFYLLAAALFVFTGCNSSKEQKPDLEKMPSEQAEPEAMKSEYVTGVITEIQPGKDGYTAKIKTTSGEEFYGTISRANLTDPATYTSKAIGDTLTIKGDHWQMENQNHITVREIK